MNRRILLFILLALIAISITYYIYRKPTNGTEEAIPTVTVKTIQPQKVRLWSEFSGRLQAVDTAEIRPEVSGRITEVHFEDGGLVKAGDVIFVIDPRPYEAAVARAEAKVATAKANAYYAKLEMDRAANMIKTQAVAQRIYDENFNANEVAVAAIKSAEADLKQAKVDLEHAYVRAPISGRAGRVELTVGNLVQPGINAPLMTRIVANDPIYADFEVDEQTYLDSVRNVAHNRKLEREIPVELYIHGDKKDVYKGTIYSFDNRLDVASGTIRARAKFDNSDGVLVPGMFVTVALSLGEDNEVLLVPQQAISTDLNKKYVYLVDKDNKVIYREVVLGKEYGNQRIILRGLEPEDRVIVNGVQHIKAGEFVKPEEAKVP
ncbi:MAG: efflux RND transporter periplasmic adaptor subunit [Parachlamydia sp.]|nr:efflux RND transporter periplasmic adaptor subunit [Parachlamydia sp.]